MSKSGETFDDIKSVIRSHRSKVTRTVAKRKRTNRQTLHKKLKIEPHKKPGVKSGAPEGQQFVIEKAFFVDLLMSCLIDVQLIVSIGMPITSLH